MENNLEGLTKQELIEKVEGLEGILLGIMKQKENHLVDQIEKSTEINQKAFRVLADYHRFLSVFIGFEEKMRLKMYECSKEILDLKSSMIDHLNNLLKSLRKSHELSLDSLNLLKKEITSLHRRLSFILSIVIAFLLVFTITNLIRLMN